jgi:ribulose-phosphate 3-epimerase
MKQIPENRPLIAPSLLSCDFARIAEEVHAIEAAGADLLHVDVMDGHFVPNITIGPLIVEAIARHATRPLDVHLMIAEPDRYLQAFAEAGADILTVHWETCAHLHRSVQAIHALDIPAGVSLNPATPVSVLEDILEDVEMVLLMSVNPGFGGQRFIPGHWRESRRCGPWPGHAGGKTCASRSTAGSQKRMQRRCLRRGLIFLSPVRPYSVPEIMLPIYKRCALPRRGPESWRYESNGYGTPMSCKLFFQA